jgi:hypothetical protein
MASGAASGGSIDGLAGDSYHGSAHVLLSVPRAAVLTEKELRDGALSHFLQSPEFIKKLSKEGKRVPSSFVFALFFLFQAHARGRPHGQPLWEAWARHHLAARTGEHALFKWSDEELAVLEEARMIETAVKYREALDEHYERLLRPLILEYPDFFPPTIGRQDFFLAFSAASAARAKVEGIDEEVLLPLPLRQHPSGRARLEEVEQELLSPTGEVSMRRMINLVSSGGAPVTPGVEVTLDSLSSSKKYNEDLLLDCGYMWDELGAASLPLRMSLSAEASAPKGLLEERDGLLRLADLNETSDFTLTHGVVPPKLRLWSRIRMATDAEIEDAQGSVEALERPLSSATEDEVASTLIISIGSVRAIFEHEVEEDDLILASSTARRLPPRHDMAVRNRRLSKLLLDGALKRVSDEALTPEANQRRSEEQRAEQNKASGKSEPPASSGGYSTARERKRQEKERRRKEQKREEVRRRREAKRQAEAAAV